METPKPPREFWLPLNTLIINSDANRPDGIHVVEHSAYAAALAEVEHLKLSNKLLRDQRDSADCEIERLNGEVEFWKNNKQSAIISVLAEALERVVLQFEDMQDSKQIDGIWHSVANDALEKLKKWKESK